jgi:hypothetical protein
MNKLGFGHIVKFITEIPTDGPRKRNKKRAVLLIFFGHLAKLEEIRLRYKGTTR